MESETPPTSRREVGNTKWGWAAAGVAGVCGVRPHHSLPECRVGGTVASVASSPSSSSREAPSSGDGPPSANAGPAFVLALRVACVVLFFLSASHARQVRKATLTRRPLGPIHRRRRLLARSAPARLSQLLCVCLTISRIRTSVTDPSGCWQTTQRAQPPRLPPRTARWLRAHRDRIARHLACSFRKAVAAALHPPPPQPSACPTRPPQTRRDPTQERCTSFCTPVPATISPKRARRPAAAAPTPATPLARFQIQVKTLTPTVVTLEVTRATTIADILVALSCRLGGVCAIPSSWHLAAGHRHLSRSAALSDYNIRDATRLTLLGTLAGGATTPMPTFAGRSENSVPTGAIPDATVRAFLHNASQDDEQLSFCATFHSTKSRRLQTYAGSLTSSSSKYTFAWQWRWSATTQNWERQSTPLDVPSYPPDSPDTALTMIATLTQTGAMLHRCEAGQNKRMPRKSLATMADEARFDDEDIAELLEPIGPSTRERARDTRHATADLPTPVLSAKLTRDSILSCPLNCGKCTGVKWPGLEAHIVQHLSSGQPPNQQQREAIERITTQFNARICVCGLRLARKGLCPTCATRTNRTFTANDTADHSTNAPQPGPPATPPTQELPPDLRPAALPSMEEAFATRVNTTLHIPKGCRARFNRILRQVTNDCTFLNDERSWTLFAMFTKSLLGPIPRGGGRGQQHVHRGLESTINRRMDAWEDGRHSELWHTATQKVPMRAGAASALVGVMKLARDGFYSRAVARFTAAKVQAISDIVHATLRRLHPSAPPPAIPVPTCPAPIVTNEIFLAALRSMDPLTSPGTMGLRVTHLHELLLEDPTGATATQLTALINLLLRGAAHGSIRPYLAGASLTALAKANNGTRPIAAGEILRRLASKCAISVIRSRNDAFFLPFQYGVGCKAGTERVVHMVRRVWRAKHSSGPGGREAPDFVLLKVDLENAFNKVSRNTMLEAVSAFAPELLAWVGFLYGARSVLWFGHLKVDSEQGVQQGDPLGPLLFALVMSLIIIRIHQACGRDDLPAPDTPAAQPAHTAQLALNHWYLDDGVLGGSHRLIATAIAILEQEGPAHGLYLNPGKCELVWLSEDAKRRGEKFFSASFARDHRLVGDFSVLGAPIGSESHCCAWLMDNVLEPCRISWREMAGLSDTQVAYTLVRACCSANRVAHLLRSTPPDLIRAAVRTFDTEMRTAFCSLINVSLTDTQWRQAILPTSMGGCGISYAGRHLDGAYAASVAFAASADGWSPLEAEGYATALGEVRRCIGAAADPLALKQKGISEALNALALKVLVDRAPSEAERARLKAVSAPSCGAWLNVIPSEKMGLAIRPRAFTVAILHRLGAALFGPGSRCPFCNTLMDEAGLHASLCRHGGFFGVRHGACAEIVYRSAGAAAMAPRLEVTGLLESGERPADILVLATKCCDVAVTHPLQPKYLSLTAADAIGAPSSAAEQYATTVKVAKYAARLEAKGLSLVPLVATAYGSWCRAADELFDDIAKRTAGRTNRTTDACKQMLIGRLSVALIKGLTRSILERQGDADLLFSTTWAPQVDDDTSPVTSSLDDETGIAVAADIPEDATTIPSPPASPPITPSAHHQHPTLAAATDRTAQPLTQLKLAHVASAAAPESPELELLPPTPDSPRSSTSSGF